MKKYISYLLVAAPIAVFLFFTVRYAQNIPYNDDYPSILQFMLNKAKAHTTGELFQLYFAPYGEHRIFFVRLFSTLQMMLAGKLNFQFLPLIGNIGFVVAFIFLARSANIERERKLLCIIPAAYIIFQLQSWSNNVWSMASLSNTIIFCWIILSLYYLFKETKLSFIAGLFFALLATYTNGNGVFVLFVAAITFLLRKRFLQSGITLVLFLVFFMLNNTGASGSILEKITHQGPAKIAGMFFVFLGSNFFHPSYIFVSIAAGVAFVLFFAYLFFIKKYYLVNPVSFSLYLLIFLTGIAIATQREILDIYIAAPSRYRLYCSLLIAMSYIALVELFPGLRGKTVIWGAGVAAFLFFAASNYVAIGKLRGRYELNRSYSFLLNHHIYLSHSIDSLHQASLAQHLINPYQVSLNSLLLPAGNNQVILPWDKDVTGQLTDTGRADNCRYIKGWAGKADEGNTLNRIYVLVYRNRTLKTYKANFLEVPDFINDKEMIRYATCGFLAVIPETEYIAADSVQLGLSRDIQGHNIAPFRTIIK